MIVVNCCCLTAFSAPRLVVLNLTIVKRKSADFIQIINDICYVSVMCQANVIVSYVSYAKE